MAALSNSEHIRFGIIGPGKDAIAWARTLDSFDSDAWYYSPEGEDRGLVSEITDSVSVETEVPYFVDGYTDVLICPGPLTPRREETMEEALLGGVSVMCAPPLGLTQDAAEDMMESAKHGQAALATIIPAIYSASYQQTVRWLHGSIGDIQYIRITWADTQWGKDPLWDIMPEPVALFHGMGFDDINSMRMRQGPGRVSISFTGEIDIDVTAISGAAVPEHSIQVLGSDGAIECNPFQEDVRIRLINGETAKDYSTGIGLRRNMLLYFCRSLREWRSEGKEPPFGEVGVRVASLLAQVDESLASQDL